MKKEDLSAVLTYASALWNTLKMPEKDEDYVVALSVWYDLLGEYELPIIKAGMLELAKESDFCNVAKIAEKCRAIQKLALNELQDEDSIVNEIRRAIQGAFYHANENFEKLSPIAKRIVGQPKNLKEWGLMDSATVSSVIMSNIKKSARNQLLTEDRLEVINKNGLQQIAMGSKTKQLQNKNINECGELKSPELEEIDY